MIKYFILNYNSVYEEGSNMRKSLYKIIIFIISIINLILLLVVCLYLGIFNFLKKHSIVA